MQFIVDHLARPDTTGGWTHLLPPAVDAALVAAKVKGKLGPLSFSTANHRLAVWAKWDRLQHWDNPSEAPAVKALLRETRKAQARQGLSVRKNTAVELEPLQAMLATCNDGVRGTRPAVASLERRWPAQLGNRGFTDRRPAPPRRRHLALYTRGNQNR